MNPKDTKPEAEFEVVEATPMPRKPHAAIHGDAAKLPKSVGMGRIVASFLVAASADGFQWLFPPAFWLADGFAFIALLLIWGLRVEILLFLIPEMIPGLDLFPTWIAAVLVLVARNKAAASPTP